MHHAPNTTRTQQIRQNDRHKIYHMKYERAPSETPSHQEPQWLHSLPNEPPMQELESVPVNLSYLLSDFSLLTLAYCTLAMQHL